jgi:nitrite reductase/ring-hydroxylating ferredoxin subunit
MIIEGGGPAGIRLGRVERSPTVFTTHDDEIMVVEVDGVWLGVSNVCSHKMGPLNEGGLCNEVLECPWHGFRFSLRSGECLSGKARPLRRYSISVTSDGVAYAEEIRHENP